MPQRPISLGLPNIPQLVTDVAGDLVEWRDDSYYRISDYDAVDPFFISVVSDSDLWMYVSSTGGLTAGRRDAEHALFPYETVDKLHVSHSHTGPKTVVRCCGEDHTRIWQPFNDKGRLHYQLKRSVYKHTLGCELWFEETNRTLGLTFRYGWRPSDRFGWVRTAELVNESSCERQLEIVDGVQNILPPGIDKGLQASSSCLVDAYKYVECDPETKLAVYGLTANIVDRPEASEALWVTVAWQSGLEAAITLLGDRLWNRFMLGQNPAPQSELKGRRGSYLLKSEIKLTPGEARSWHIVLDTPVSQAGVVELKQRLKGDMKTYLERDITEGRSHLSHLVASADAFQATGDPIASTHHAANVLFNIARGGILPNQYLVDREDLADFLMKRNAPIAASHAEWLASLPPSLTLMDLRDRAEACNEVNLIRLCDEYLPLVFSRRHGDPSRPWNQFSIAMKDPDGSPRYAYQGNWRDIFQNWEALCRSFPECLESVIAKFVNASTVDGFNPYRLSNEGIDWEMADPDDPWSSIGYWGDHQIVYLLRLIEASQAHHPGQLTGLLSQDRFSYADVPYDIKPYTDIIRDPQQTITFNWGRQKAIDDRVGATGTDGRLVPRDGEVLHVSLVEKLLVPILAKLSSLVPEGGIWMNTMRPEWNDANNALAGNGLSVVTACYLHRHLDFCTSLLERASVGSFRLSSYVTDWLTAAAKAIDGFRSPEMDDRKRRAFMDATGAAFSEYRTRVYADGPGESKAVEAGRIIDLLRQGRKLIAETIKANRRPDGLYHAYNILHLSNDGAMVSSLPLMLEGQVAALSSGLLSSEEALEVLRALRASALYRSDQHSYLLYPVRQLPTYLEKNRVPDSVMVRCPTLAARMKSGDCSILGRDAEGQLRFHPDFHNARALRARIESDLPAVEVEALLDAYEEVFKHRAFTGRSGTMYGYEGIGCIYWHMIAKLLVAAQEVFGHAVDEGQPEALVKQLKAYYFDIRAGLGFMKQPDTFGAFPLDPYSHTPASAGAKQPGMTGAVKELILTRWGELGIQVRDGRISFNPRLLSDDEFLREPATFRYVDTAGVARALPLKIGSLAFTLCQVPIVYRRAAACQVTIRSADGSEQPTAGCTTEEACAREIFKRTGRISRITVDLPPTLMSSG